MRNWPTPSKPWRQQRSACPRAAIRCLGVLIDQVASRVRVENPGLEIERVHVSPRDKGEAPPDDCHLYLCSGGPGSPFDGDGEQWVDDFSAFLDGVVDDTDATLFTLAYFDPARPGPVVLRQHELQRRSR